MDCKKKLYACRPKSGPQQIQTQRTRRKQRAEPCDPASLERAVRQLLADKISGNQFGIWLLAPEHLRLGTWDLLCAWSQSGGQTIWTRMALHLVHEAAFYVNALRHQRSLTQKGFDLSNGLPFCPHRFCHSSIHQMLARAPHHTVAEVQALQVAVGEVFLRRSYNRSRPSSSVMDGCLLMRSEGEEAGTEETVPLRVPDKSRTKDDDEDENDWEKTLSRYGAQPPWVALPRQAPQDMRWQHPVHRH